MLTSCCQQLNRFNSGVMVVRPSQEAYDRVLKTAATITSPDGTYSHQIVFFHRLELYQIVFFNRLGLYQTSLDFGERQYKSGI